MAKVFAISGFVAQFKSAQNTLHFSDFDGRKIKFLSK